MSDPFRILCLGDIVGKDAGRLIDQRLKDWRQQLEIDFCIANAENLIEGSGLNGRSARWLLQSGCDMLTTGDHIWKRGEIKKALDDARILRPANYHSFSPGHGWSSRRLTEDGPLVGVINVMGQVFTRPCDSPFAALDAGLQALSDCAYIVVDVHAEATAEKAALANYVDGKATAVFGTHTHVATADEQILPGGTGFITDVGMCGPHRSIIGRSIEPVVEAMKTAEYRRFSVATEDLRLNGVVFTCDPASRRCIGVERVRLDAEGPLQA